MPDDRLFWRPHEKSMTLGGLASHLAHLPSWIVYTVDLDSLDVAPVGQPPLRQPEMTSQKALLDHFDRTGFTLRVGDIRKLRNRGA